MWDLGVCLFVMATRRFPFSDGTAQGLFRKIRRGQFEFPPEEETAPALTASGLKMFYCNSFSVKRIIKERLLVLDPKLRATAAELLHDPWLRPS